MKHKQEFKEGDNVTFLSCGEAERLPATVMSVSIDNDGERVFYELSGDIVSIRTTGKSILESEYCCDQGTNYTGRQFRDVDGKMWICNSDWAGNHKDYVHACRDGNEVATIEISEIYCFPEGIKT